MIKNQKYFLKIFNEKKEEIKLLQMKLQLVGNIESPEEKMYLEKKINEINKKNDNRFIIFTHRIKEGAEKISKILRESSYKPFEISNDNHNSKSFYIITGKNSFELLNFNGVDIDNLPTILILINKKIWIVFIM